MSTIVITNIDGDNWNWYYVNGKLVTEGHDSLPSVTLEAVLEKVAKLVSSVAHPQEFEYEYAFIDADLAERACYNADTLDEFFELGLDRSELE